MNNTTGLAYITLLQAKKGLQELIDTDKRLIDSGVYKNENVYVARDNIRFYEAEIAKLDKLML